ncbi:MAG: dihydroneopterin aldolase/2-amino-4-hydroxy-6-hydroxymethyldihydropteridine diphosphokinase [Glaciecola sp.]|jgi:dihydroneopterin aldolase/2-amino-4-hydroxy-6-hydroxymethyldihydropteridine diphosphokinase
MTKALSNTRAQAAIALGGNMGDVESTFRRALLRLDKNPGITLLRRSDWIETVAVGGPVGQANFLNGAISLETTLAPSDLFAACQEVETHFGRDRSNEEHCGPRTLDLDILLYGDQSVAQEDLTIPHPRMTERRFVLEPLAQIVPDWIVPGADATVEECLLRLPEGANL